MFKFLNKIKTISNYMDKLLIIVLVIALAYTASKLKTQTESKKVKPTVFLNFPTRGVKLPYTHVGTLHNKERLHPLYGRATYLGSQNWNYYTTTNNVNFIKIPVINKGKSCLKRFGCNELQDGDTVFLKQYNQNFTVTLYPKEGLIYNPHIF